MRRILWQLSIVGLLLLNTGCGTFCRQGPGYGRTSAPKAIFVPPPPPSALVPASAIGSPQGAFPTVPPPGASFGPPAGYPTAPPPSITPFPQNPPPGRTESKWQPLDNRDVTPRIQLYAPEAVEKPQGNESPLERKPNVRATFPSIPQFAEAKANTYAGLRPSLDGLDWLQTNHVGTVVHVRLPGEDDSADKKQVEDRSIRYIAFEISPATLTKEKADEFIALIRANARQGIFVYDKDGSLAGSMWYLQLRWGEILDDDAAQLRARPLGLQNMREGQHREMWLAVQKVLAENNP